MRADPPRRPYVYESERNIVVRSTAEIVADRALVGRDRGFHSALRALAATTAQHLGVLRHDLGRIALLPLLILPLTGADAALDVDLAALGEVLADDLGLPSPHHHAVPLGGFLLLAALVGPLLGGGDAEVRDRLLALRVAQLRVRAEVADQDHFVDATHAATPFVRMGSPLRGPCVRGE